MTKPKNFEDAMRQLEAIVADLEQGDLPLEKSIARYKEGVELGKYCGTKLREAEKQIQELTRDGDGFELRDLT